MVGILSLIATTILAQQENTANNILDKVKEKTGTFKSISADFTFSMQNREMEIDEKNEGSIKIKGQKYMVDLPDVGIKVYSDGESIWNYMKDGNQVTISSIDDEGSELMDPSSIFSIYEKGFDSKYVQEKKEGSKTVHQIELFPDEDEYQVSKIVLFIEKSSHLIHSATLFGTDGNEYGILVRKMNTDGDLPDTDFIFDQSKFGDVEVIDFR